jgi:dihydrodipicolinate synthase/N-acetylneuraminate lyase
MKDNLQDLIEHTSSLGNIELIKITGTDTETQISAVSEDKSVIILEGENDLLSVVGKTGIKTCIAGIGRLSDEQIKFLLHQLSGCLMPTQWNAILKRLEEIEDESNS